MTEFQTHSTSAGSVVQRAMEPRELVRELHAVQHLAVAEIPWNRLAELLRQLCRARHAAVVRKEGDDASIALMGRASDDPDWTPLQLQPQGIDILARAAERGYMHAPATGADGQNWIVAAIALDGLQKHTVILHIPSLERAQVNELVLRALLCCNFGISSSTAANAPIAEELAVALDLVSQVMRQERFDSACLTLANGLASKWTLIQAAVGWMQGENLRLQAISHLDRFERNSVQTITLEKALQAAQVSAHPIFWQMEQGQDGADPHVLAEAGKQVSALSALAIPIPDAEGFVHGVIWAAFDVCSPKQTPDALQLCVELLQPRLADLHERSLPLRLRAWHHFQRTAGRLFGPENSLFKASAAIISLLLLYVAFGTWPYRIEASAQLNTEATRLISAQFDGRVEKVLATAGDLVKANDLLVTLDTRELEQKHAELTAEISRFQAELNKHQADGRLAEAEIAQAKMEQSEAKERRISGYLQQAQSRAPFEGVIVEGERKDLIGAPVRKGDKIFKLAKVEGLFVTLMVAERNMRDIEAGATGEVSLISHADYNIPIRITSVIPVAQVKGQEGNQFMITAVLLQEPQAWWRPGMTGVARVDAGRRNIAWILTHRLLDSLRLLLWW
jgi:uncharacterized small protein (DUF1192 family)